MKILSLFFILFFASEIALGVTPTCERALSTEAPKPTEVKPSGKNSDGLDFSRLTPVSNIFDRSEGSLFSNIFNLFSKGENNGEAARTEGEAKATAENNGEAARTEGEGEAVEAKTLDISRINQQDLNGDYPIHLAVHRGNIKRGASVEEINALIELNANLNVKNTDGETPLHLAVRILPEAIEPLIKGGSNPNIRNNKGETPLLSLLNKNQAGLDTSQVGLKVIQTIVEQGRADLSLQDHDSQSTALHVVLEKYISFDSQIVSYLIEQGLSGDAWKKTNDIGQNIFHTFASARLFSDKEQEKRGVSKMDMENTVQDVFSALKQGLNSKNREESDQNSKAFYSLINGKDKDGNTPLHISSSLKVSSLLIAANANIEAKNNQEQTPIYSVIQNSFLQKKEEAAPHIGHFIKEGAGLTTKDSLGMTPLEYAIFLGHIPAVEIILQNVTNKTFNEIFSSKNNSDRTPLEEARHLVELYSKKPKEKLEGVAKEKFEDRQKARKAIVGLLESARKVRGEGL